MSLIGERVAWRSAVKTPEQRLVLVALGMLSDDQMRVRFGFAALAEITRLGEMETQRAVGELIALKLLRLIQCSGKTTRVRLTLVGLGIDFKREGSRLSPEITERLVSLLGGSTAVGRLLQVYPSAVCNWRHLGMTLLSLRDLI